MAKGLEKDTETWVKESCNKAEMFDSCLGVATFRPLRKLRGKKPENRT